MQWTAPIQRHRNDRCWLLTDLHEGVYERPLYTRFQTFQQGTLERPQSLTDAHLCWPIPRTPQPQIRVSGLLRVVQRPSGHLEEIFYFSEQESRPGSLGSRVRVRLRMHKPLPGGTPITQTGRGVWQLA